MVRIGTPFTSGATRVVLLGSGELGKEVVIELQRFGCEVVAVDAYGNAPAMQVCGLRMRAHMIFLATLARVWAKIKARDLNLHRGALYVDQPTINVSSPDCFGFAWLSSIGRTLSSPSHP